MSKRLNDMNKEDIEKNFLSEEVEIPTSEKVVVSSHIPKMRKIVFLNNRDPGCPLMFHYASATHPLKHYNLMHGKTYELPEEVIIHLEGQNENDPYTCHKRNYGRRFRDDGVSECFVNGYTPYFQCREVRA